MEAAKCNVSCKVDYEYTPSVPITSSTALYMITGSSGSYTEYSKSPAPLDGEEVFIPNIQSAGEYELKVKLTVNGVTDERKATFQLDNCDVSFCEKPSIEKVYLGEGDQIIMDYIVDGKDFNAVEYQIARNDKFTDIVHFRVIMGSDYKPNEYIEMNDGTITDDTIYYIRARKHCLPTGVSAWSNVVEFRSGKWGTRKTLDAYCLAYGDDLDRDICIGIRDYAWKTKVTLSTSEPKVGSLIYLSNGMSATPENIRNLTETVPNRFRDNGLGWIRFLSFTPDLVYIVEPKQGKILDIVSGFGCSES